MRLLFVGTGRGVGGTESHLVCLALAMAERGHEVAAVVRPGEFLHRALAPGGLVTLYPGSFDRTNDPAGAAALWRAGRAFRPDWMIDSFKRQYLATGVIARALGARCACFKHIVNMHPTSARLIPRLATRFIVPSDYLRRELIARGAPAARIDVLPNPVHVGHFAPDPALRRRTREELGIGPGEVLVGFVGRLEEAKGVFPYADALEAAMGRCPRLRGLWVGDGEARSGLLERLWNSPFRQRHSHVGWVADVRPWYSAMDLLVLPSIGPETFGRASIEAQACGIPVIASRTGGIPESLVEGRTGLLLAPGDVAAWADALVRLAADDAMRGRMGAAGRAYVMEHFGHERIAGHFEELLARS